MDRATGIFVEGMGAAAATSGVLTQLQGRIFALLYLHQRLATVVSAVGWIVLVGEGRSGMAAFTSSPSRWASLAPSSRSRDDDPPGTRQPDLRWRLCLLPAMGGAPAPLEGAGCSRWSPTSRSTSSGAFPPYRAGTARGASISSTRRRVPRRGRCLRGAPPAPWRLPVEPPLRPARGTDGGRACLRLGRVSLRCARPCSGGWPRSRGRRNPHAAQHPHAGVRLRAPPRTGPTTAEIDSPSSWGG